MQIIFIVRKGEIFLKITFLGTAHGFADIGRYNPSTLIEIGEKLYVLDAGAPVDYILVNMRKKLENIKGVFITHMHEDHVTSLSPLLHSFLGWTYNKDAIVSLNYKDSRQYDDAPKSVLLLGAFRFGVFYCAALFSEARNSLGDIPTVARKTFEKYRGSLYPERRATFFTEVIPCRMRNTA